MDRDRIVEEVADIDDYFEYERPLDFISAAERRKVLRETGGDEDAANQLLVERENAKASDESQATAEAIVNGATGTMNDGNDNMTIGDTEVESRAMGEEIIPSITPTEVSDLDFSPSVIEDDDMDVLDMDAF